MGYVAHASGLFPRNQERGQQGEGPDIDCRKEVAEGRHEVTGDRRAMGEESDQ
jgi:hypothetical protein